MTTAPNHSDHAIRKFSDSFENIQGYTTHVRESAQPGSQVIILVHGIGVSEKYFRRFADILARDNTVIAVDLPGYGKSEKPKKVLNLDQLAAVLNAFIDKRSIKKPIVIGQSMGCQIVIHFATLHPDKAKKLILLSPTINNKERTAFLQLLRLLQDTTRESLLCNAIVLREYMRFGLRRFVVTQRYMIKDQPETILPLITVPLLIVRGSRDAIVPRAWTGRLASVATQASLQEIPLAPHNLQWTHPQESAALCADFIAA